MEGNDMNERVTRLDAGQCDVVRRNLTDGNLGFRLETLKFVRDKLGVNWEPVVREAARYAPSPGLFLYLNNNGDVCGTVNIRGFETLDGEGLIMADNQAIMTVVRKARNAEPRNVVNVDSDRLNIDKDRMSRKLFAQAIRFTHHIAVLLLESEAPWAVEWYRDPGHIVRIMGNGLTFGFNCKACGDYCPPGEGTFCPYCDSLRCQNNICRNRDCPGPTLICKKCRLSKRITNFERWSTVCNECRGID